MWRVRGRREVHLVRRVKYLLADPDVVRDSRWRPVGLLSAALPPMAWTLSLCLATAGAASVRAAENASTPLTAREKELVRLVQELREEVRQLRREVNERREKAEGAEHHGGEEHAGRENHGGEKRENREHHEHEEREGAERAAQVAKLFRSFDLDGDKKVSKGELFRKLEVDERDPANREKAERAFRAGDKDGDGSWSLAEFSARASGGHHGERER